MDTNCLPKTDGYGFEGGSVAGQAAFSSYHGTTLKGGGRRRRAARKAKRTARRSAKRTARRSARRSAKRTARRTARRSAKRSAKRTARRTARRVAKRTRTRSRRNTRREIDMEEMTGGQKYSASLGGYYGKTHDPSEERAFWARERKRQAEYERNNPPGKLERFLNRFSGGGDKRAEEMRRWGWVNGG